MRRMNDLAARIVNAYSAVYAVLHARWHKDEKRPTPETLAVLDHLERSGPITIGEAARHFDRAPSAISELVDRIEANGWVARVADGRDRRRTLVWLTDAGIALLERAHEALDAGALAEALARMTPDDRVRLAVGLDALVAAARTLPPPTGES